jgi:uncharacterized protein (DUF433 family)
LDATKNAVVSRDPRIMSGELVFTGTRVEVKTLVDYLKSGHTLDDFLDGFPTVSRKQAEPYLETTMEVAVAEAGWAGKTNGELLRLAEQRFEVLLSTDKCIPHQQNVSRFDLAVVLRAKSNAYEDLAPLMNEVRAKLEYTEPGTVLEVPSAN